MTEQIRIDWADVKAQINAVMSGKRWAQPMNRYLVEHRRAMSKVDSWAGGSGDNLCDWLDNGFYDDQIQSAAVLPMVESEQSNVGWHEDEGDPDAGRLYGGFDEFYFHVAPSDSQPGLRVSIDLFFAASVKPGTIKAYGAWLVSLMAGLEAAGFDLEIDAVAPVEALYEGGKRTDLNITVKRCGEISDFTEWSALLSPMGTRRVLFSAFGVASDQIGKRQTDHMAMSLPSSARGWNVRYDREENHLHITADQRYAGKFPVETMNRKLEESGLI